MLHNNIKGQGLQINTIIIIALGLIVLIILIVMVQQRTNLFSTGLRNVSEGMCAPDNEIKPIGTDCDVIYGSFKDVGAGQICCRRA
jgi:hypothetical protein